MKKEILYIIIPVILCVAGLMFKSFFLSDTLKDTQQILDLSNDLNAKFNKDSLVQNNVEGMKALYEKNKRGDQKIISYGEIITNIIQELEVMLKKSGIEYRANDINQDLEEVVKSNLGISCFYINISLSSNYEKIKKLLMLMDQSEYVINIEMLELVRGKPAQETKNAGNEEFDEFNSSAPVNMRARLEFVKFL